MRKLSECEMFKEIYGRGTDMINAINQQLFNNIGVIAPEHIETALMDLRTRSKKSAYFGFLSDALALYEQRGLIRLFNLSSANGGRSKIPTTIPYLPGVGRNRYTEGDLNGTGKDSGMLSGCRCTERLGSRQCSLFKAPVRIAAIFVLVNFNKYLLTELLVFR